MADSQKPAHDANIESFHNLEENLRVDGSELSAIPHVLQFNKRNLSQLSPVDELNASLNKYEVRFVESVATEGNGVRDTLGRYG